MYDPELLARHGFPTIAYDVIEVGERFRSDERLLRPEDVETYAFAVDDTDPWYVQEGPFGGPICHPTILANQALLLRHNRYVVPAGLHARMVYEFVAPIPLGVRARTVGRVVDKYVRRDKPYMVTEYETTDEAGAPLVRGRFVQMLFSRDTVPPAGSGPRPEPSPPADDPAIASVLGRGGRLQRGDRFGPVARTLQQRQLDAYSGVRPKSIHTDEGWARAKGFRTTIAQGMMSSAYVAALLTTAVGEGFVAGGRLDVRFLRPVHCGDTITAEATLEGFHAEPDDARGRVRATFTVAAHNQLGQQTLAGEGSGLCVR
ncbi:MAG: MaoC family dehydratase [Acidimicrobiia bacterium]